MKTKYEKAVKVLEGFKGKTMGVQALKRIVMRNLGSDERTIEGYLMTMRETKLITEVENMRFLINE